MITVIKHGNTINIANCPNCNCEFSYTSDEIRNRLALLKDETEVLKPFVFCPECAKMIDIGE